MSKNNEPEKKEQSILTLIQQIKDGQIDPKTLDKDLRQEVVEVMLAEAYNVPGIAQILKVSDKTIRRDVDDIRTRNALTPDIDLAKKTIGERVGYARIHRDHLMRLARSNNTSVSERAMAEYYASQIGFVLVTKLQSLGYLPLQPQGVVGSIHHTFDDADLNTLSADTQKQLVELDSLIEGNPDVDPSLKQLSADLRSLIEKEKLLGPEAPEAKNDR
jgi:hypothetical protein